MKIYKACEKIYPPLNFLQSDFTGFIERADTNVMQLREPSLYLYTVLKAKEQERRGGSTQSEEFCFYLKIV